MSARLRALAIEYAVARANVERLDRVWPKYGPDYEACFAASRKRHEIEDEILAEGHRLAQEDALLCAALVPESAAAPTNRDLARAEFLALSAEIGELPTGLLAGSPVAAAALPRKAWCAKHTVSDYWCSTCVAFGMDDMGNAIAISSVESACRRIVDEGDWP